MNTRDTDPSCREAYDWHQIYSADPKHTANIIKNHFQRKERQEILPVMPPESPNLHIMESVWD